MKSSRWILLGIATCTCLWCPAARSEPLPVAAPLEEPPQAPAPPEHLPLEEGEEGEEGLDLPGQTKDERDAARAHYVTGSKHIQAGEWQLALAAYQKAFSLYPSPSILVNMGYCKSQLGDDLGAWALVSQALALSDQDQGPQLSDQRLTAAREERARLESRLAVVEVPSEVTLDIRITGAVLEPTSVEDAWLARRNPGATGQWTAVPPSSRIYLTPGTYELTRRVSGTTLAETIRCEAGKTVLLLTPAAPATASPDAEPAVELAGEKEPSRHTEKQDSSESTSPESASPRDRSSQTLRSLGMASLIVGGAAFLTALIAGAVYIDADSKLSEGCAANGQCSADLAPTVSQYEAAAITTNVALLTGLTATAAGVSLILLEPQPKGPDVSLSITPSAVRLHGRF